MESYDALVIGAGPAGLSAALYLAKGGLRVLVMGDGRSVMKTAWLDQTYLGIEEQMDGPDFLALGVRQAELLGVKVVEEKMLRMEQQDGRYLVSTKQGNEYAGDYIILALGNSVATAVKLGLEIEDSEEPHLVSVIKTDKRGRTSMPNVYAAGVVAGTISQAIIAAGHGAEVALNLLTDRAGGESVYFHESKPRAARRAEQE